MTWTKIDDQFYDHPKVVAAGPLGIALFVCGLSYCSRHLTDGFISVVQVRRLIDIDNPGDVAERLVSVGLWERRDGGYQVHDYLEYNPSRAKVKAIRQARAEAGHTGGLRSGEARRKQAEEEAEAKMKQTSSKTEAKAKAKTNSRSRSRSESPSPKEETPSAANAPASPSAYLVNQPSPQSKKRKTSKRKKTPTPEAVRVFRENAHRYPPKAWYSKIAEVVGEDPADLELWGQIVLAYIGLGWNPGNVKNMLAYYEKREIPGMKQPKTANAEPHSGIRQWLTEQGIEAQ